MRKKERTRDSAVMTSSTIPPAKCFSPGMLLSPRGGSVRDAEPLADLHGVGVDRPENSVAGREGTLEQRSSSLDIALGLE